MQILKVFVEEPAALEVLAADSDPAARAGSEPISLEAFLARPGYNRAYLAGTDLATGAVGVTLLDDPRAFAMPLMRALRTDRVWAGNERVGAEALVSAAPGTVLVAHDRPPSADLLARLQASRARDSLGAVRSVLDAGGAVLRAEPATDGCDWSVFAAWPLADAFRAACEPVAGLRRWVIPFSTARAEHRFHFERYDLELFAAYEL